MLLWVGTAIVMGSCAKEGMETIPVEPSFVQPEAALQQLQEKIADAPDGWEFTLAGKERGFYAGYLDFQTPAEAEMVVDDGIDPNPSVAKTAYTLHVAHGSAVLSLHAGAFSDFAQREQQVDTTYTFLAIHEDTIHFRGDRYGNLLKLTESSSAHADAYRQEGIAHTMDNVDRLLGLPFYFKTLTVNGAAYDLLFRPEQRKLFIHYGGKQHYQLHETVYSHTATGVAFKTPLVDGVNVLGGIDEFEVSVDDQSLSAVVNGLPAQFVSDFVPSAIDTTFARTVINNPLHELELANEDGTTAKQGYSISADGFTVAGQPDALHLNDIPDYEFMAFFHRIVGLDYGSCRFYLGGSKGFAPYGPAVVPQLSGSGGYLRFVLVGDYGTPPTDVETTINTFVELFTHSSGFWVLKSGAASYDLISTDVEGGQRWIRFE